MPPPLRALLAAAAVVAVGCGSGFDEQKETARPLKVAHALGESKVPGQAKRPLALSDGGLDAILALGVRPVGALLPGGALPAYLARRGAGTEVKPPLVAAHLLGVEVLDPDLILGAKKTQGRLYERLSEIAPTVLSDVPAKTDWKLDLRLFGEALGRTNQAEGLLTGWDETAARARHALRGVRTRKVAVVGADRRGAATPESFAGRVVTDAGLEPTGMKTADVVLRVHDSAWWRGDGVLAARTALADLRRRLLR